MKITLEIQDGQSAVKYPCLMRSKANPDLIVFFTHRSHGVVVSNSESPARGYTSSIWDGYLFEPLPVGSKVTFEND